MVFAFEEESEKCEAKWLLRMFLDWKPSLNVLKILIKKSCEIVDLPKFAVVQIATWWSSIIN